MDLQNRILMQFEQSINTKRTAAECLGPAIEQAAMLCIDALLNNFKILFF